MAQLNTRFYILVQKCPLARARTLRALRTSIEIIHLYALRGFGEAIRAFNMKCNLIYSNSASS
jgi:hypothetical protein